MVKPSSVPLLVALTEGTDIALDKPILLIGRHQECDILISSRKISRRHCCIALVEDHLVVRDLGSTNGIRINGIKVVEGNLQTNDELMIGNLRFQLQWGQEGSNGNGKHREKEGGIRAGEPHGRREESCDVPMMIPDMELSHPVLAGKAAAPKPTGAPAPDATVKPGLFEVSDDIGLAPLEPPPPK